MNRLATLLLTLLALAAIAVLVVLLQPFLRPAGRNITPPPVSATPPPTP